MSEAPEKQNIAQTAEMFAAIVLFGQLSTAGLILALAERQALDPGRVFEFYRTLAESMERQPNASAPMRNAARMLREIEALARNMTTIPAGAGRG